MVDRIVKQGPAYYSAIYKSADTAEKGCFFAKDAVAFCERLITQSDPLSDLVRGLQDIIEIADQAKKGAEDMRGQFRKIRVELFEVPFCIEIKYMRSINSAIIDSERYTRHYRINQVEFKTK